MFFCWMQVRHTKEKHIERVLQIEYLEKEKRERYFSSLMDDVEGKDQRVVSMYKCDYKKSPFVKNLRSIKNLARVRTLRAGILASRRSTPHMVSADSSCSIQSINSRSQTVEEKQGDPVSSLRDGCEVAYGNAHSVLSPRIYQESDLCASSFRSSAMETYRTIGHIPVSSSELLVTGNASGDSTWAVREGDIEGNSKSNQPKRKLPRWPFLGFGRKRFLERALAESAKRMRAQKRLHSGEYDRFVARKKVIEEVINNDNKTKEFSQEQNQINLNMIESEHELYYERITEKQRRHQEQFKTPLIGKSREKAKKIAKKMALIQRREILKSKRGIMSTNMSDTNVQENSNQLLTELSIDVLQQVHINDSNCE
eukprot:Gb_24911 [translate_table: standard]